MANALMNSQIFFWIGGVFSIFLIAGVLLPLRRYYFGTWVALRACLLAVVIGLGIAVFSAWTTAFLSPAGLSDKAFIVRWVVSFAVIAASYYLALCLITLRKGGPMGYNVSTVILAVIVFSLFLLTIIRSNGILSDKVSSVIFISIYGSLYLATLLYFTVSGMSDAPVVKNFLIRDTLPLGKGEKVKVILLTGQSNAEGVSRVEYLKKNVPEEDFLRYTSSYDNVLINYWNYNGQTSSGGAFVHVTAGEGCGVNNEFYGPELGMADALSARFPGETIYIIKYAWGGSNLHTQWLSPSSGGKTGELYQAFINFTKDCLNYLKKRNYDPQVYAMCWMQGESDAFGGFAAPYGERSANLIRDVRAELSDYASDKGIYFLDAGISDSIHWPLYKVVNDGKRKNADRVEKYIYLDTIAAGLDYRKEPVEQPDKAHYDSVSMIKLGRMFAEEAIKLLD